MIAWGVGRMFDDDVVPPVIRASCGKDVEEYHKWARQRDEYTSMFYREVSEPRSVPLPLPRIRPRPSLISSPRHVVGLVDEGEAPPMRCVRVCVAGRPRS